MRDEDIMALEMAVYDLKEALEKAQTPAPLVWKVADNFIFADTAEGRAVIVRDGYGYFLELGSSLCQHLDTKEEAKDKAQELHNEKVLSFLTPIK